MPAGLLSSPTLYWSVPTASIKSAYLFTSERYFEAAVLVPFMDHLISQMEARYQSHVQKARLLQDLLCTTQVGICFFFNFWPTCTSLNIFVKCFFYTCIHSATVLCDSYQQEVLDPPPLPYASDSQTSLASL